MGRYTGRSSGTRRKGAGEPQKSATPDKKIPTEKKAFSRDSKRTVEPNIPLIPVTVPSAKARATTEIPMKMPPTKHSAGEKVVREGSPIPPAKTELIFNADQGNVSRVAHV
jgi:hypothetical protein